MGKDADKVVRNIILQHWSGPMDALCFFSSENITAYAKEVGADYKQLRGDVFRPDMAPQCQKVHMLDECWDEYDTVVMLDMDMFVRKGMGKDIFHPDITGVGIHILMQWGLAKKLRYFYPHLGNRKYSFWGGAIYKLSREMRQRLRVHIREDEIAQFNDSFWDEGIMHRLAVLAKVKKHYLDSRWSCSSFGDIEDAYLIHIRPRRMIGTEKAAYPKIRTYEQLVERGLIA